MQRGRLGNFCFCTFLFGPLLAVSGLVHGQSEISQASEPPSNIPLIRVSTDFVVLDALVEDKKTGNLVSGLRSSDFQLFEDGSPQAITYFSHDQLPLSVVFLFDLTDSVRPVLKPLAEGARQVLAHLKPQDEACIMVFSSHTELLQDFTTDRGLATAAIAKAAGMKSEDGTFIHEDIYEAVGQALSSTVPGSRRVLVWLTDGTSNLENSFTKKAIGKQAPEQLHTKQESTDKLLRSGVVVSALIEKSAQTDALVIAADASPFGLIFGARTGDIRRYADETGGPVLNSSRQDAADRLAALIDELRGRYTLGYKPSVPKPAGTFCKLRVALRPHTSEQIPNERKLLVRTRQGYYR